MRGPAFVLSAGISQTELLRALASLCALHRVPFFAELLFSRRPRTDGPGRLQATMPIIRKAASDWVQPVRFDS